MTPLRDALLTTATVIDLGHGEYTLDGSVLVRGRTVRGAGATIRLAPSADRNAAAIILSGIGPRLLGTVTVIGAAPYGAPFDPAREAQHAIRVDGATNAEIGGWHVRNVYGDGIYVGTARQLAHGAWTHNLKVHDVVFDQIGRHAVTLNALDHGTLARLDIGRVNLALVDIEPPGHPWGCRYLAWTDSDIRDSGGGYVLANKGQGKPHAVHDILLDGIRCHRRLFNVNVNPPADLRRERFTVRNCAGEGEAHSSPLVFRRVDGVTVSNVRQKMRGAPLVSTRDCTDVIVDGAPRN